MNNMLRFLMNKFHTPTNFSFCFVPHVASRIIIMKTLLIFAWIGFLAIAADNGLRLHDLVTGFKQSNQILLFRDFVRKDKPALLPISISHTQNFTFAPNIITQVKSIDQKYNDHGASVSIIAGGPGRTFVTLEYQSQRGHSIHHKVEIYGILKTDTLRR